MADKIVLWSANAQAQVAAIDRETALGILHAIDDYPTTGVGDMKKLRPPRRELRLRVGDYRVFFLSHALRSIEILARPTTQREPVGHATCFGIVLARLLLSCWTPPSLSIETEQSRAHLSDFLDSTLICCGGSASIPQLPDIP